MISHPIEQRNRQLRRATRDLPGAVAYDNIRPINVPGRFDGQTLLEVLCQMHPHIGRKQWQRWFRAGHIVRGNRAVGMNRVVRGGEQFQHLFPGTVEPEVNADIRILREDASLIAVDKPAPLPVHPCGRFNRNTLTSLLRAVYQQGDLRVVHRLDANTTGIVLLARDAEAATRIGRQFEVNAIVKQYLVRCHGHPVEDEFVCDESISRDRGAAGTRVVCRRGLPATTRFRVQQRLEDGTSLLTAHPMTGRTNQIRIHLWSMAMPVMGDPTYLQGGRLASRATLGVKDPPMCLHAAALALAHPQSGRPLKLVSTNPPWLNTPHRAATSKT